MGFRLDPATGRIWGKGAVKGIWNFTLQVQDTNNASATASQGYTVSVKLSL